MPKFKTGARPTPRHKLAAAKPFHAPRLFAPPPSFGVVPNQLNVWGNDQYGDCVTAEEAYAKAAYSVLLGLPELFVQEQDVINWASQNGFLNGANLTDVMDAMAKSGLPVGGVTYQDGGYSSVDWTNPATLQAALVQGPVKIGVASAQLQSVPGIGQANGWFATGFSQDANEDHCVALTGYGTIAQCFAFLGTPVPSGVDGTQPGYLLFTWGTVGVIDQPSMLAITAEAWLRSPTTVGEGPAPAPTPPAPPSPPAPPAPPAPPSPPSPPTPPAPVPATGFSGTLTFQGGSLVGTNSTAAGGLGAINWTTLLLLVWQYGSVAVPIIYADIQAGKTLSQIVADLEAAFGLSRKGRPCGGCK